MTLGIFINNMMLSLAQLNKYQVPAFIGWDQYPNHGGWKSFLKRGLREPLTLDFEQMF